MTHATFTAELLFDQELFLSLRRLDKTLIDILAAHGEDVDGQVRDTFTGLAREIGGDRLTLDIRLGEGETRLILALTGDADAAESLQRRLAVIVGGFARDLPAVSVIWLETGLPLPVAAFLEALASAAAPVAPRRVAGSRRRPSRRPGARTAAYDMVHASRPGRRIAVQQDAQVADYHAHIRRTLLREADAEELETLRGETGAVPIEARLSTWAMSAAVASFSLPVAAPLVILNVARGEDMRVASLAMGLAGLFVTLDSSGAMAALAN